jgi:3-oxoacyl-[acyl-carrier-protein] synthase III
MHGLRSQRCLLRVYFLAANGFTVHRKGRYKKVILVAADKMSSITDFRPYNVCAIWRCTVAVLLELQQKSWV